MMDMKKFKVGSLVVTSGGSFAKVLKVSNGIVFCSKLVDDAQVAKDAKNDSINFRFNDYSAKVAGISLASEGGKSADSDEAKADAEKKEADAKAKAEAEKEALEKSANGADETEAELKAKEEAEAKANADKLDYKCLKGVDFPRNVPHNKGDIIKLTEEEASKFADGLIEKVKKGFFNRG